jgi:type I restriction enzyme S subunit
VSGLLVQEFDRLAQAPGGVARLRELILSLAVRGKLVPQDLNDEPALLLLKTISMEKDKLIAQGRLNPEKALSLANDPHPFAIPETWTWVPMGEVVEIVRGITFPASEKTKEPAPGRIACLRTANVQESIEWSDLLFVNRSFMGREDQLLKLHDIVMSMANSRELVGKVALVDHIPQSAATFGGFLGVLRPWKIDPRYAMALLRSSYARSTLIESSSQTTNIANISLGKLRPLPFPLPPLAEQSRIVARVDELMRLCDALEAKGRLEAEQHTRLLDTLLGTLTDSATPEELAVNWQRVAEHFDLLLDRPEAVDALEQTILQLAVRGLLVPQDPDDESAEVLLAQVRAQKTKLIEDGKIKREKALPVVDAEAAPFALPRGWAWARFPELGEFGRGKSKHRPRNDPALFSPPIYPLVQTGEVARAKGTIREYHSKYSELGLAQSRLWPTGTLCITIAANIADAAVLGFDACFPDSVVGFVPADCLGGTAYFLAFLETAKTDLVKFAPATAQKNINLEILESLLVPLPPKSEIERIVARVTELRRLCADLRERLAASQATQSRLAASLVESILV